MRLAELQMQFQDGILKDDKAILAAIADPPRTGRAAMFAVYYDAYRLRLAEFLSKDFPVLRDFLGENAFSGLVEGYILAAPSRRQPNARWYSERLPDFMMESPAWRNNRRAIDLARLERALSEAFDAADAPVSSIYALSDIVMEDWPRLVFEYHPSVKLLDLTLGTAQIYGALAGGGETPAAQDGMESVLVWRSGGESCYRSLEASERLAFFETRNGKTFEDICALVAFQNNGRDMTKHVAGFLSQWFADGIVSHVLVAN